jgi:hypothetical protein
MVVVGFLMFPWTVASAGGAPYRFPDPGGSIDFPAGTLCSFEMLDTNVVDNEVWTVFPVQPNGDQVWKVTGSLVVTHTNVSTGKSLTLNESGPATLTYHADGSITADFRGPGELWLFAGDVPSGPDDLYVTGQYVLDVSPSGQGTLVSLTGSHYDLCAALS